MVQSSVVPGLTDPEPLPLGVEALLWGVLVQRIPVLFMRSTPGGTAGYSGLQQG